jgi:hypothetical protein
MSEEPCCVCGEWTTGTRLLDVTLLRADIRRKHIAGMLDEKHICGKCVSRCDGCKKVVIYQQKKVAKGLCAICSVGKK